MATTLTLEKIQGTFNLQQKTVSIIDEYIQSILSDTNYSTNHNSYADSVMQHIFLNIRNSYQDGVFISQGLINNAPYYVSTSLSHALRSAQEFLVDLAYIMSDLKNKKGNEYLRYLKFILTIENEELQRLGLDNTSTENQLKKIFPPDLDLPKRSGQWTDTSRKDKIKEGLKVYKIEFPHFADFRSEFHSRLSSTAHGNKNTIYTFLRTPEENRLKLEIDLTLSAGQFDITLLSALECYIKLYLGQNKDYREIIKSIFPCQYLQFHNFQGQIKDSYGK